MAELAVMSFGDERHERAVETVRAHCGWLSALVRRLPGPRQMIPTRGEIPAQVLQRESWFVDEDPAVVDAASGGQEGLRATRPCTCVFLSYSLQGSISVQQHHNGNNRVEHILIRTK